MNFTAKLLLACGALSAAASVLLGAAGAHMFSGLPQGALAWFNIALQYHQFHALGLIGADLVAAQRPGSRWIAAAGALMLAGTLLFSGNLYLRSLADFHALHAVTPYGGVAFILGWLALAIGAIGK